LGYFLIDVFGDRRYPDIPALVREH